MNACFYGHVEVAKYLIVKGTLLDIQEYNDGCTALMCASLYGNKTTVEALLYKGADINAQYNDGWTAAMWGIAGGSLECVRTLIKNGYNMRIRDIEGNSKGVRVEFSSNVIET